MRGFVWLIMRRKRAVAISFALTLAIAAAGGSVMWHFHMPLAWLLGAMIATGLGALVRLPLESVRSTLKHILHA